MASVLRSDAQACVRWAKSTRANVQRGREAFPRPALRPFRPDFPPLGLPVERPRRRPAAALGGVGRPSARPTAAPADPTGARRGARRGGTRECNCAAPEANASTPELGTRTNAIGARWTRLPSAKDAIAVRPLTRGGLAGPAEAASRGGLRRPPARRRPPGRGAQSTAQGGTSVCSGKHSSHWRRIFFHFSFTRLEAARPDLLHSCGCALRMRP